MFRNLFICNKNEFIVLSNSENLKSCQIKNEMINVFFLLKFSFLCLHYRGVFHIPSSNTQILNSKHVNPRPGSYYVGDQNGEKIGTRIGLGDFVVYNLLLLLILSPYSSIRTKIFLTLGCIISVQIGYIGTIIIFDRLWKNLTVPGIPLPVITFSIYLFIVNIIKTSLNQCN